jgi:hypothetical protein
MLRCCFAFAMLMASAGYAKDAPPPVTGPQDAIVMADAANAGHAGRFAMTVASVGHVRGEVFLNSSADYRAPDDLTFRLSPNVVSGFRKEFGQSPETYFLGKHVVMDGTVRRVLIVNTDDYFHRVVSANRWQHMVRILFAHQLVSAD